MGLRTSEVLMELETATRRQLQYWDHVGFISPSGRTSGGHARYTPEDVSRLRVALILIQFGMSTQSVRANSELLDLLEWKVSNDPTRSEIPRDDPPAGSGGCDVTMMIQHQYEDTLRENVRLLAENEQLLDEVERLQDLAAQQAGYEDYKEALAEARDANPPRCGEETVERIRPSIDFTKLDEPVGNWVVVEKGTQTLLGSAAELPDAMAMAGVERGADNIVVARIPPDIACV